jgi:hypothetical protein
LTNIGFVNHVEDFGVPIGGTLAANCEAGCSHWVNSSGIMELNKVAHYAQPILWYALDELSSINSRHPR